MNNKYKKLALDTIIFAIGSLGSKLILFIMVPIYTNYMTKDEYGIAELVFTVAQFLIPFLSIVIFDAVVRFGLSKNERKEDVLLVGLIVVGVSSILMIIITPFLSFYKPIAEWKWYLCFYVIFNILNSVELCYIKSKEMNKLYAILSIIQTFLMAMLNVLFLIVFKQGVKGYLIAYICSNGIIGIIAFLIAKLPTDLRKAKLNKKLMNEMIKYSAPLILNNVSWWVIHSSDKVMVEAMISTAALGLYTVSAKIPSLINVIVTIFQQAWGISAVKEVEGENDTSFYTKVFTFLILLTTGICVTIVGIIKLFMRFYVGNDFYAAWIYVPLLLNSAVFATMAGYFGSLYGALKLSVNNMISTAIAAVVNIAINFMLIPVIGIWGAVIGTLVSYIVLAYIRMYDISRKIHLDINQMKLILNFVIMIIQAIVVSLDYYVYIISVFVFVIFILINKNDILDLIKIRRGKNEKN